MPNWGIALIGVAGIIIGAVINQIIHWVDRKQRFKVMTFERRLEAHQQAYYQCQKLNSALSKGNKDEIIKLASEVDDW